MKKSNFSEQKYGCGQNSCGEDGSLCPTCKKSFMASTEMKCPDGNPRCSGERPCDLCKATAQSLVETRGQGGKKMDMVPLQPVHGSSKQEQCSDCGKTLGSTNDCYLCQVILKSVQSDQNEKKDCAANRFFPRAGGGGGCSAEEVSISLKHEPARHSSCPKCQGPERPCNDCLERIISSLGNDGDTSNPNVPKISFHPRFGPKPNELRAFTKEGMKNLRMKMNKKFRGYCEDGDFFPEPEFEITAELLSELIHSRFHHKGFEGNNNSCFIVVILVIFSLDRNLIERINTQVFAGFLMRYVVEKFLRSLFVDRMLIELFRIEAVGLMPESMRVEFMDVSCPNDFLLQLEEHGIVDKGPYLSPPMDSEGSRVSASCVVLERNNGERSDVLPNAISHAVGETSLSGTLLFQFKEGFNIEGRAVPQGAGAMGFPTKELHVNKKVLSLIAFTRIQRTHYQIVLCLDGMFFNFNSLSPANEGHTLPVLSIMTEQEAHSLFSTDAHTCVFKCSEK